ncbi:hypothetical protein HNQ07_001503 [Deinococcus metalli]|uniref:Uncharacterized protein n=1 Tax=Deinococcus metalli TaxID=1141878 RepID=A0A7W8KDB8_9DEIO|nr:hypothetical protein [Deinococcus metalli]GHF41226.1 hypothetical protein GCM10017781_17380 [Deinococcus metalli]
MTDPSTPTRPPGALTPAGLPTAPRHPWTPALLIVIALSLIPALILAVQRVQYEQAQKTTALVMDYPALVTQARRYGLEPQALLDKYKALGVNGVALYEDTIASLEQRGEVYLKNGSDLAADFPNQGVKTNAVYMRAATPQIAEALRARYTIPTRDVTVDGKTWVEWPSDPRYLPAGPDTQRVAELKAQGLVLVYRPYQDEAVPIQKVGADWPDVPFIAFTGDEVIGARTPDLLSQVDKAIGTRMPAIIEGNIQKGLEDLVITHGGARLFALAPSWQNQLDPLDVASKYNLAGRERGMRLMYLRPYPTIGETETMLTRASELLKKSGVTVGTPTVQFFTPSPLLKALSMIGPLAALLLLGLSFPLARLGMIAAGVTAVLAFGLNTLHPFESAALVAAVTFPALGLILRRARVTDWFIATGLSLVGVLFVSALGASRESTLGLEPFRGVGLTLLLPLTLVALSFLPRQDIRKTLGDIYAAPIRLGDVAVMALGFVLLATVYERRGNATGGSVSDFEASLRRDVQDSIIRPRFKEVFAHPLGLLGLTGTLPGYFSGLLILAGVVGQSSILNTFSHFHTPLLVSAARCFIGLGLGLALGVVLTALLRFVLRAWAAPQRAPVRA